MFAPVVVVVVSVAGWHHGELPGEVGFAPLSAVRHLVLSHSG